MGDGRIASVGRARPEADDPADPELKGEGSGEKKEIESAVGAPGEHERTGLRQDREAEAPRGAEKSEGGPGKPGLVPREQEIRSCAARKRSCPPMKVACAEMPIRCSLSAA